MEEESIADVNNQRTVIELSLLTCLLFWVWAMVCEPKSMYLTCMCGNSGDRGGSAVCSMMLQNRLHTCMPSFYFVLYLEVRTFESHLCVPLHHSF